MKKIYLARVCKGLVRNTVTVEEPIRCVSQVGADELNLPSPLIFTQRHGVYALNGDGAKPAFTVITPLLHNDRGALVLAEPKTGKTHQVCA